MVEGCEVQGSSFSVWKFTSLGFMISGLAVSGASARFEGWVSADQDASWLWA